MGVRMTGGEAIRRHQPTRGRFAASSDRIRARIAALPRLARLSAVRFEEHPDRHVGHLRGHAFNGTFPGPERAHGKTRADAGARVSGQNTRPRCVTSSNVVHGYASARVSTRAHSNAKRWMKCQCVPPVLRHCACLDEDRRVCRSFASLSAKSAVMRAKCLRSTPRSLRSWPASTNWTTPAQPAGDGTFRQVAVRLPESTKAFARFLTSQTPGQCDSNRIELRRVKIRRAITEPPACLRPLPQLQQLAASGSKSHGTPAPARYSACIVA